MSGTFANFNTWEATVQANPDGNPAYVGIGSGTDSGFPPPSGHNFNGTQQSFLGFAYNPGVFGGSTNWVLLSFSDPLDTGSGFTTGDTGIPYDSIPHTFRIVQPCPHTKSCNVYIDGVLFTTGDQFPTGSEIDTNPSSVTLANENYGSFTSVNVTVSDFGGCPTISVTPSSLAYVNTMYSFQPSQGDGTIANGRIAQDGTCYSQLLNVTASGAWSVTTNVPWLQVTPSSGSGNGTILVTLLSVGFPQDGFGRIKSTTNAKVMPPVSTPYTGAVSVTNGATTVNIPVSFVVGYGNQLGG